jgi:hypothetical protein
MSHRTDSNFVTVSGFFDNGTMFLFRGIYRIFGDKLHRLLAAIQSIGSFMQNLDDVVALHTFVDFQFLCHNTSLFLY